MLEDFPSVQMPFEWLVQLVPPLKTRAFSIASSQSAHPNQVHLTVDVVSSTTPYKRKRKGLCSTWLATLDPQDGKSTKIPLYTILVTKTIFLLIYMLDFFFPFMQPSTFQAGSIKVRFLHHHHHFP